MVWGSQVQGMLFLAADASLHNPHRLRVSFSLSLRVSTDSSPGSAERIDDAAAGGFENGASAGAVLLLSSSSSANELHELRLEGRSSLTSRSPGLSEMWSTAQDRVPEPEEDAALIGRFLIVWEAIHWPPRLIPLF